MTEALRVAAQAWLEGDPDPETRAELNALLAAQDFGALADRLQPLTFGTAGLRGGVGAGSGRMNLAVVLRTAYGIAQYLLESADAAKKPIVIGFDARPTSRAFAEASAEVWRAAGLAVFAFSKPTATPLCAFMGRELGAAITVVVTASHNPRGDNGYKVYGPDAVQIVAPMDAQIARHIASAPPANQVPRADATEVTLLADDALEASFRALSAAVPQVPGGRDLRIVHSALHGVGTRPMLRALADGGFTDVHVVAAQAEPDGTFPTTPFPNPEEPGTMDLGLAEAERRDAQLLLVSDPDADRLAAAARLDGAMTIVDGNQVGALLADHLLESWSGAETPLVLSSIVSSPLVGILAEARGARHQRTHTGFKWLWSAGLALTRSGAGRFCFAYEEALGYSVFSGVRDKDGIAAGRTLAEAAARLSTRNATLFDRLYELYAEHGLWISAARNIALGGADAAQLAQRLDVLAGSSDLVLEEDVVTRVVDYRRGAETRVAWLGEAPLLELELRSGGRLFVRPSGTEPKLKLYGHVRRDVTRRSEFARELAAARHFAAAQLRTLQSVLQL